MSDEATRGDERQRDPRDGEQRHDDADVDEAWTHRYAVIPAASSAPNVSGAASEIRIPRQASSMNPNHHQAGSHEAELLADHREDVVVVRVRENDAPAAARSPRRREEPSQPEGEQTPGPSGTPSFRAFANGSRKDCSRSSW